ncbi:glutaredoxin family protein [Oceanobacillus alkalisoli]|uniref:glutaredoxin family protein n=1 Tax=Oceanobacillus alkalisoli TaxID=2925113 RepID=UPI001EE46680|nr:glutaredoxin domain-containing protein [Oceanobacillus alkalisoli]MCG5103926.1 glutathione S-transferase N-terminal domain-containing protein [Oceanobacillus alkalisoli]
MENNITVYTTTQCPYCKMVKDFLNEKDIPFKEVNVENDPAMMQKVVEQTGQMGVPQTEINGKWILGFDPERILETIKQ